MREDVIRRLLNWESALHYAEENLAIAEHFSKHGSDEIETVETRNGKSFQEVVSVTAQQGLRDAAIIVFRQVFGQGKGSPDIAANDDLDINQIRDRMKLNTVTTLQLPQAFFDGLMDKITGQRHERIAHYDGRRGFERVNPFVTKMNMPGSVLRQPEWDLLLWIVVTMREFVHKEWVAMATALESAKKKPAPDSGAG